MKLQIKKMKLVVIQLLILLINISFLILGVGDSFRFWCICGTIDIVILFYLLVLWQKEIVTPVNMFFASFCLFQFGLPIMYVFDENYRNFYIELFSDNLLLEAAKYSVISIISASLAISFSMISEKNYYNKKESQLERFFNINRRTVAKAAFILFVICAMIIVPMTGLTAIKQLMSGVYSTTNRDVMIESALLRFVQEYFYSSALLYLCFSDNSMKKKLVKIIFGLVCLNMLLLADRALGLVGLLVLVYFNTYIENNDKEKKNPIRIRKIFFFVSVIVLIYLMVIIAAKRVGNQVDFSIINVLFDSVLSELGFNFTSICFVMDYIPSIDSFKWGATYLLSFLQLIPSSFGLGGLFSDSGMALGETWLYNMNNVHGRSFLNFGVGFSIIAESYMNFAWAGLILLFLIVFLAARLLRIKSGSRWKNYIVLIMLLELMLLPRRQFVTLLKSVEYAIVFMSLYVYLFVYINKRNKLG